LYFISIHFYKLCHIFTFNKLTFWYSVIKKGLVIYWRFWLLFCMALQMKQYANKSECMKKLQNVTANRITNILCRSFYG